MIYLTLFIVFSSIVKFFLFMDISKLNIHVYMHGCTSIIQGLQSVNHVSFYLLELVYHGIRTRGRKHGIRTESSYKSCREFIKWTC